MFQLCEMYDGRLPEDASAEEKYDGTMFISKKGKLLNRNLRYITYQYPELQLPRDAVLVGELVVLDENGVSDFNLILRRNVDNRLEIRLRSKIYPATAMIFDALEYQGRNLCDRPLRERQEVLSNIPLPDRVKMAERWDIGSEDDVKRLLDQMEKEGREGIIIKDLNATYQPTRNRNWLKLPIFRYGFFEIRGYETTENEGFVIFIQNDGYEQKVACNSIELREKILRGRKIAKIRFKSENEGALRQPSLKGVYREIPKGAKK